MKPKVFMTRSGKVVVGKPDYWNITTLTDKLPNTPILPWNHYDSPWENPEVEERPREASQNIADAAAGIKQLLQQLEQSYPTETTTDKLTVAMKAIEQIEKDSSLRQRILSAMQYDVAAVWEKLIDRPAASLTIAALADWEKSTNS